MTCLVPRVPLAALLAAAAVGGALGPATAGPRGMTSFLVTS